MALPTIFVEEPKFLRIEIESLDIAAMTLTGHDIDAPETPPCRIRYPEEQGGREEMKKVLSVGDVVCAVTPLKLPDGSLKASEIVLEPDYLVSPQQMGRADIYGAGAFFFWLDMIRDNFAHLYERRPQTLSRRDYILRGNFANACLAEYSAGGKAGAMDLLRTFFTGNQLDLTAADPGKPWRDECQTAQRNIQRMMTDVLPREHGRPPGSWQIEAPLFSPVYGLSAKADAIAYDLSKKTAMVFELKSGKWAQNGGRESSRREHRCQPAFYRDILLFSLGIPREDVTPLLFYSSENKNSRNGKLFTESGFKENIQRYILLRNRIVWLSEKMRRGEFRALVDGLQPEAFQSEDNPFFNPDEIKELLRPFQESSPAALAYVYRQLRFLAEERRRGCLGAESLGGGHGAAGAAWRRPLPVRKENGSVLSGLKACGKAERDCLGRIAALTFDTTLAPSNKCCSIRMGDSACLYRCGNGASDVFTAIVFSVNVRKITSKTVEVELANPQSENLFRLTDSARYVLEPQPPSLAFGKSQCQGLWHFLTGDARRRDLVLNLARPESDESRTLPITDSQNRYPNHFELLLHAWRAKDWFLIWGPPGTGKTNYAMRALVDQAMAVPGMNILLLAFTYKATDNICEMLEDRQKQPGAGAGESYLRLGNPGKCAPGLRGRMFGRGGLCGRNRDQVKDILADARIVVAPVSALTPSHPLFHNLGKRFDLAVVDEASQLLDTHILPLFCAKSPDGETPLIGKFIFIGDHKQLPAVVQQSRKNSRITEEALRKLGFADCGESFFARLWKIAGEGKDETLCAVLPRQFRMHPMIAEFPRRLFYEQKLEDAGEFHQTADLPPVPEDCTDPFDRFVLGRRMGFFPEDGRNGTSKANDAEARRCAAVIRVLLSNPAHPLCEEGKPKARPYAPEEIGVIVPFRSQIASIRDALSNELPPIGIGDDRIDRILIDTVERFQGSERDVILFSTVIAHARQGEMIGARQYEEEDDGDDGEGDIDRKLNVAVTRARERFYLIGKEEALRGLRAYGELLQFISDKDGKYEDDGLPF